jgi:nitrilase
LRTERRVDKTAGVSERAAAGQGANVMTEEINGDELVVGVAQIAPVWLQREATLAKVVQWVRRAAAEGCRLVAFGEALAPGYPFWLEHTDAARFESPLQKAIHARYVEESVDVEAGHLADVCRAARECGIDVVLGVMERPSDRGGHSIYCSRVHIRADGSVASVHRKLMPTYEERLSWAPGDGHGLQVHRVGRFSVGSLNCYENWMPLARAALQAQGEDLHVALWPGNLRNTEECTRFLAREGRSYVLAASGLLSRERVPSDELVSAMLERCPEWLANGGSGIVSPTGEWLAGPVVGEEALLVQRLRHSDVLRERQIFDPAGHYSRPDVLQLRVDRRRQAVASFVDAAP